MPHCLTALARSAGAATALFLALTASALAQETPRPLRGHEVKFGILAHDTGLFSSPKEDGIDVNVQWLLPTATILKAIGSPRPHVGASYATKGVSQVYAGFTWDWTLSRKVYATGELGGAVHNDDDLDPPRGRDDPDERYLGCHVLFRLAGSIGYKVNERVSVEFYADHISNATLCSSNEGLENAGVRVGYKF